MSGLVLFSFFLLPIQPPSRAAFENPKQIGDWLLQHSKEPLNDKTRITLTAVNGESPRIGFTCWKDTNRLVAEIQQVTLSGRPTGGSLRMNKEPGRAASWLLVNDRLLQTDVSREELEGVIKSKGRIVVEVVTDQKEGIKRIYDSPAKVNQAIRTFLRVCGAKSVPIQSDLGEQLKSLNEFLGEAVLLLASSPDPIEARLQVVWDDYLRHLTAQHMPFDDLKQQLKSLQVEMMEREPRDMTGEEASSVAYKVVVLHSSVVTHMSDALE